jgi:Domain of Unknown Function (DUF1080)
MPKQVNGNRGIRPRLFALTTSIMILSMRVYSQQMNSVDTAASVQSFLGRWDLTLKTPVREAPTWLEITQEDGQVKAQMVSRWGHARSLPKIEIANGRITFVSPKEEEDRKNDMVFEGKLSGKILVGTTTGPDGTAWQWTGERAPSLERKSTPKWEKPIQLLNGKDLSGWRMSDPNATPAWKVENGMLVSPGHGPELISDAKFDDFKLHVEFNCARGSTYAVGTSSRSKTTRSQKGRLCAPEACTASWPPRRNSRAGRENGRPTTSRWLDEWSPLRKMVRPLLINRKSPASQGGLLIVTKHYPGRSICRVVRPATSLFGISRLRQRGDLVTASPASANRDLRHRRLNAVGSGRPIANRLKCRSTSRSRSDWFIEFAKRICPATN